uniref:Uncharacterized protein n=1 Tax=Vitis vinifera TaxID=29760 RepID=F6HNT8_VITVI
MQKPKLPENYLDPLRSEFRAGRVQKRARLTTPASFDGVTRVDSASFEARAFVASESEVEEGRW